MQKTLECIKCKNNNNTKDLKVKRTRMNIEDSEYICNYYICPICNEINLFTVDNNITNKCFKELEKDNQKMKNWQMNGCIISQNMKKKNLKLRLKYNLLLRTLNNNIIGKDYQLFADDNKTIIKTGKIQLPNF